MKTYHQLTREQRYQIAALREAGHNQSEIARGIGAHKSTVARELRRNRHAWLPAAARPPLALSRRAEQGPPCTDGTALGRGPPSGAAGLESEQIAGRAAEEGAFHVTGIDRVREAGLQAQTCSGSCAASSLPTARSTSCGRLLRHGFVGVLDKADAEW